VAQHQSTIEGGKAMTRMDIEQYLVATMEADPLLVHVVAVGERFIQITNHGGWVEQFDIELSGEDTWGEAEWRLAATVYGRNNLWTIIEMYINRWESKS
jgi:hypothetical protein